jgi:hypothetical protein
MEYTMPVNDGTLSGWPFVNFGMATRGTQTTTGPGRAAIVYPRRKFTFLVEFYINPNVLAQNRVQTDLQQHIQNGRLLATLRSIDHPKTTMVTETLRSYNKKVILQTKTDYQPATMAFHDDNTSIATALWREYRSYYQGEGTLGSTSVRSGNVNNLNLSEFRSGNGLVGGAVRTEMENRPSLGVTLKQDTGRHFFDAIRVYDLGSDPDSVNVYTFIHPVVTSMDHDNLDYEERTGNLGLSMTFDYEGYYHLVGLNNAPFHDVIEQQLGFRPITNAPRVSGHAHMLSSQPNAPLTTSGGGTPSPIIPGVGPGVTFEPLLGTGTGPAPPNAGGALLIGGMTTQEILDIINRTSTRVA